MGRRDWHFEPVAPGAPGPRVVLHEDYTLKQQQSHEPATAHTVAPLGRVRLRRLYFIRGRKSMTWGDNTYSCGACGGSGRARCVKCQGAGTLPATCPRCSGSGQNHATNAHCSACNGGGRLEVHCPSCSGGYEQCQRCHGAGRY